MGVFCWEKSAAIIVAAGSGKRMGHTTKKQFIPLRGNPLLYYSLKVFSDVGIGRIILVTAEEDFSYCEEKFIKSHVFSCPISLVRGGKERYDSVYAGLQQAAGAEYVFIHDGARPCLEKEVLRRIAESVKEYQACVAAVPVKDTIKIVNQQGFAVETPNRNDLWAVQTPQVFVYSIVMEAYDKMMHEPKKESLVTDDAMVVENYSHYSVKMVEGSYRNIKVTTKEDLVMAEAYLLEKWKKEEKK